MQTIPLKVYSELKAKYPKALLLFRIGEAYQATQKDATVIATVLPLHVRKQEDEAGNLTEYVVFPFHALNTYLPKLVTCGFQVAVCDSLEMQKDKGIQTTLF